VRVAELRRLFGLAAVYPLLLVVLATVLFSQVGVPLLASIQDIVMSERAPISPVAIWICHVGVRFGPYAMWFGIGLALLAILWWLASRRMVASQTDWLDRTIGWLPGINRMLATGRTAAFLETLRLLVAQKIPLERALTLSAESTGDRLLMRDAEELARKVCAGTNAVPRTDRFWRLPRLVAWLLTTDQSHEALTAALDSMANAYLERAQRMGDFLRVYLPIWLTLFIGGGVTIVYVLALSIPWLATLSEFDRF
jgi:type II secretory pathway component PulF